MDKRVEKVIENKKWTVTALKDLCQLLSLEKSGDRETLVRRVFDFLKAPSASVSKPIYLLLHTVVAELLFSG